MKELNVSDFINSLNYENVELSSYQGEDNAVSGKYALTEAEIFQNEWEIEDYAPKPKSPSLINSYYNKDILTEGTLLKEKYLVDELDKILEKEYGGNVISKGVYCSGEGLKGVSDLRSPVRSMGISPEREQEIQHFECRKRSSSPKHSQEPLYSRRLPGQGHSTSPEMPDIERSMNTSPEREQEIQHFEYRKQSSSLKDSQEPLYSRRLPGHGHSTSPEMPDIVRSMGISPEREQKIRHFEYRKQSSSPNDNHEPLYSRRSPAHRHSASPRDSDSKVDCSRAFTSPTRQTEQSSQQADEELLYTRRSPRYKYSSSPERSVGGSKILYPQLSTSPRKQPQEDSIIGAEESMYTHRLGRHIYSPSVKPDKDMKRVQSRTSTSPQKRYQQDSFGHKRSPSPQRLERVRSRSSSSPPRMSQQDSPRVIQESLYSHRSPKQKHMPSPERSSGGRRRVITQFSNSPRRLSRQESPKRDDLRRKRLSPSPRVPYSPNHRGRNRSPLRSPTRQRFSSSGYRRGVRNRSRSRSPYPRERYRKSPKKSSPRRRSPPPLRHHQSYRRSPPRRKPWSPPRNRDTGVGRPGKNVFIAGFNFVTTEKDLKRKFSRFGRVTDIRIVRDSRTGDSRGFGFLSMGQDKEADDAIRALDQTEWNGRVVLVEKSKSR